MRARVPHRARRHAFTLIELLVVIAIIALLAAILFPVFARARENARKSSCMNNLKQMAIAWHQYSQDFDEFTLPYSTTGGSGGNAFPWNRLLQPYLKSAQVIHCPSDTKQQNYGYNFRVGCSFVESTNTTTFGRGLAEIPLPAQTPLFTDVNGDSSGTNGNLNDQQALVFLIDSGGGPNANYTSRQLNDRINPGSSNWVTPPGTTGQVAATRHLDTANYAFVDGHVKAMRNEGGKAARVGMDYAPDGILGDATTYH